MTREDAKEVVALMQAYVEGEPLQYDDYGWRDVTNPSFELCASDFYTGRYRIKPVNTALSTTLFPTKI